jgi:DNA-binding SARP family transcriptional activator
MPLQELIRHSPAKLVSAQRIGELVEANQYREAAELLQQALRIGEKDDHNLVAQLLMLARQICLTSTQLHEEIERYQQAQEDARSREQQLKEQMRVVLELMVEANLQTRAFPNGHKSAETTSLWTRFSQLLKRPAFASTEDQFVVSTTPRIALPMNPNQLLVYSLGAFEVYRNGELIENWPGRKGTLIFKYLLLNRGTQIRKEVLMDLFWPDSDEDAQRNNLNVAIYGLRQALRNGDSSLSHILFLNDCYSLNPELDLWVDYEAFQVAYQAGKRLQQIEDKAGAVREYLAAANFYQEDFLGEDRYEEWMETLRHELQANYLSLLDYLSAYYFEHQDYSACLSVCNKILTIEPCFEDAHCRIMRCYCHQGQPYLALRQYDRCVKTLETELGVPPMPDTERLRQQIHSGQSI